MSISPGDLVKRGTVESRARADGVDAGDAVNITASGELDVASDGDTFAGIATADGLCLDGVIVANVHTNDTDGAVVEGASLSLSPTGGELYRDYSLDIDDNPVYDQPGPVTALSDEGGTWSGKDVPDGYAVVHVHFRN